MPDRVQTLMAKGRTNQPLHIWVDEDWYDHPSIRALADAGYTVGTTSLTPGMYPDLILARAAHNWTVDMFEKPVNLEAALKAARRRKKRAKA